jgi:hypothetical protein
MALDKQVLYQPRCSLLVVEESICLEFFTKIHRDRVGILPIFYRIMMTSSMMFHGLQALEGTLTQIWSEQ